MAGGPPVWQPANNIEQALVEAWRRQDFAAYLTTVARAPLYLPRPAGERAGNRQPVLTQHRDGRTYLVVGTSPDALRYAVEDRADGWQLTTFAEIHRLLPNREWGLAVSPNVPAGGYLEPEHLRQMAALVQDDPVFEPAGPVEGMMWRAIRTGDRATYLDALALAEPVLLTSAPTRARDLRHPDFPWRPILIDDQPSIVVFTSAQRMAAAVSEPVPAVVVTTLELVAAWPDPRYQLVVNPGSVIQGVLRGETVPALVDVARSVVARAGKVGAQPAPVPAAESAAARAVTVGADRVPRYLDDGHGRVSGVVRADDEPDPQAEHQIRWFVETGGPLAVPGETVTDLDLPSGAQLFERDDAGWRLVATWYVELGRWLPAVARVLRRNDP